MFKLLLISKVFIWLTISLYIVSSLLFYIYQNQSVWSKSFAAYSLVIQYLSFFVLLTIVIGFPLYRVFTNVPATSFPLFYYLSLFLILINILCSLFLFISDKRKYPEMRTTLSSYITKSPAGIMLLLENKDK